MEILMVSLKSKLTLLSDINTVAQPPERPSSTVVMSKLYMSNNQ